MPLFYGFTKEHENVIPTFAGTASGFRVKHGMTDFIFGSMTAQFVGL